VVLRFFQTERDVMLLTLRVMLAIVIFPHGAQKLLGWYGGFGLEGTMQFFASIGVPALLAVAVIASDFFGSIALALGLWARLAAVGTLAVMLGAMVLVHGEYGFFINWYGAQQGEGIQFQLLASAASALLIAKGAGAWSLDGIVARRLAPSGAGSLADRDAPRIVRAAA